MTNPVLFQKTFQIQGEDFARAGEASVAVKNILKEVGFDREVIRRIAIAAYEAEMNVVMYGEGGEMQFTVHQDSVNLIIQDWGPGIPDVVWAMQEGYSTATDEMREMGFGAGMGLPNIQKNADRFDIKSTIGQGTRLVIAFQSSSKRTVR